MAGCFDCGTEYGGDRWVEAVIPDDVWNRIRPEGAAEHAGLLCIGCIARRLTRISSPDVPVWLLGTEPLMAMPGDPGDSPEGMNILRNYNRIKAEAVREASKNLQFFMYGKDVYDEITQEKGWEHLDAYADKLERGDNNG